MGVASGCGCKEVYRFLILLIPTPLVFVLFCSSIPTFCSFIHTVMHDKLYTNIIIFTINIHV